MRPDWLVTPLEQPVRLIRQPRSNEIALCNGLVRRVFRTAPYFATVDLVKMTGATVIRGVKPEAVITLHGQALEVGGLHGQHDYAYLDPAWLHRMASAPDAFRLTGFSTGRPRARYSWQPARDLRETRRQSHDGHATVARDHDFRTHQSRAGAAYDCQPEVACA